jgi:hypothetical protein
MPRAAHFRSVSAVPGGRRADRFDVVLNLNGSGALEYQRALYRLAALQRRLQFKKHQMNAAWLERSALARLDLEAALKLTLEFNSFSSSRLSPVAQPIDWA